MKTFERNEEALIREREKDKESKEGGNSDWSMFHFLKPGRTVLRILPPYNEKGVWFRGLKEYYFEQDGQKFFLTSPRTNGDPDPLWDWGEGVYEKGNEAAVKEAKRFRPRTQFLYNAIVLSNSGDATAVDGVKVLKTGITVKRDLVDLDTDVDSGYGDITNIQKGFNVIIDREGEGLDTSYTVKLQREPCDIRDTLKSLGVDFDSLDLHNLDELLPSKSYEELQGILELVRRPNSVPTSGPAPLPTQEALDTAEGEGMGSPVMTSPSGSVTEVPAVEPAPVSGR